MGTFQSFKKDRQRELVMKITIITKSCFLCLFAFILQAGALEPDAQPVSTEKNIATSQSLRPTKEEQETFVNFSFDQVDIKFLVKLVGDLTGRKFVIAKDVEGKVTVVTPPKIPLSEVYPLFLSILDANGCAVTEHNGIYKVLKRARPTVPIAPVRSEGEPMPAGGLVTKVIRLSHVNAAEVAAFLEPLVGGEKTGHLSFLEATNHLIITDTVENQMRIEKILQRIDKPGLAQATEIYHLKYAQAEDIARELNQAISGVYSTIMTRGERLKQRLPRPSRAGATIPCNALVVAAPHSNSLILVGTNMQISDLKEIIKRIDIEPKTGYGHLQAIFLKYLSAEEAAESLNALLSKNDKAVQNKIAIESSTGNNALLIDAAPQDFEMVKELISQLDHPPQQVLVEVMFAELTFNDNRDIGVEFLGADSLHEGSKVAIGGMRTAEGESELMSNILKGIVPHGLTFGLAKGTYTDAQGNIVRGFPALLNIRAIQENATFKILSNVPLWTQNNQEAKVNIGKNIPILKSTISGGAGTARDIIENIDRIDVGIKLTVTPHVNPNNEILLKLNPCLEAIIESTTGGKAFTPTIAKREVTTTLTVPSGETIVISGLIREDTVSRIRKIPYLGSIPGIGWLFRRTIINKERSNLLIFVTPRVISKFSEARELTEQLRVKTGLSTNVENTPIIFKEK